jgi:hypothetical protein
VPASVTGVITNTATVVTATSDPTPTNNAASAQTPPEPLHYYLAEGATGAFFDMDILIANPNTAPAPVTLTFFREDGSVFTQNRTVDAQSRLTVKVEELPGLEFTTMSAKVTSDLGYPLAVERTMTWDSNSYGGHTATAVPAPAPRWYFGEGSQGTFFDTYVLLENDHPHPVEATLTFLREGNPPVVKPYTIGASSRLTVQTQQIPELRDSSFGIVVDAPEPIVAERAMYFGNTPARIWTGGHESIGITELSRRWFHPEGATGTFFDMFILMSNPQDVEAHVTMEFILPTGEVITVPQTIPAKGRLTINPEVLDDPRLANASLSTRVLSDVPIASERSMYWVGDSDVLWGEAHNSFGLVDSALRQAVAEGRIGGPLNHTTYILLSNPWQSAADVTVTFLRENGAPPVVKTYTVPPTTRFNIDVGSMVAELRNESFGAFLEVTNGFTITVERSVYWDVNGVFWGGGTNAPATRIP